jgi:hypothetical protein
VTPGVKRQTIQLDGEWRFVRDPQLERSAADLPDGELITVPGCWEAQIPDPFGIVHGWYWRDIELPPWWDRDGEVVLRFQAVMYRCAAWLDGRPIGGHEGGYVPFELPLDHHRAGTPQRLVLQVTNPLNAIEEYPALSEGRLTAAEARVPELPIREIPHGKQTWYASQSGPWRSVSVELRPRQRLDRVRAKADWASGRVEARAWTTGVTDGRIEFAVLDPSGTEVARASTPAAARATVEMQTPDPLPWHPETPYLYRLVAKLWVSSRLADESETRFGFREIRTQDGRILFNGRPILLRGALDQDLYADTISTPPSRQLLDAQIALAREMGLNLLRCHIKSPDPGYLEAADEAGMLLWCELPNWLTWTRASAARAETLMAELVDAVADHPSVVIWTIVNEDWGTDLRHSARHRSWLRDMVDRLRLMDPMRLVVDNSACPAPGGPNFHLDTDLADFHRYAAMPDAAPRWREQMEELAGRPAWLWSPHGDAVRRGDEPLVISEFGTWALPHPGALAGRWWNDTGDGVARPAGIDERFAAQGLDRIWRDVGELSAGTRRLQIEALRYQVGEIRRHPSVAGLVVTEFTDAFWEANGLLDVERRPKALHDRLIQIFGPSMLIVDLPRHDLWSGEDVVAPIRLSSQAAGVGGSLLWQLGSSAGAMEVAPWPAGTVTHLGDLHIRVPVADATADVELEVRLQGRDGSVEATSTLPCAVLPASRMTPDPLHIDLRHQVYRRELADHLREEGHEITKGTNVDLIVASSLDADALHAVNEGGRLLLLAASDDALPSHLPLDRPVRLQARWPEAQPEADFTWGGDWIGAFSWIEPRLTPNLPARAPLDFTFAEVLPQHVLTGYLPSLHRDEIFAGMFVGWVHAPVALIWTFAQGRGRLTVTTLPVARAKGPVARVLRSALVSVAST